MTYIQLNNYIEVKQPIGTFYVAKMLPRDLKRISKDNLSRYRDIENWIQREISESRQKEIRDYILNNPDATFPWTFIIAVSWETRIEDDRIIIQDRPKEAYILDGQHRLAWFDDNEENFEIIVAIFVDIEKYDQAMIFSTINWKQQKVDPSLVYDLFELAKDRSHEKVAHDIVKLLNENQSSAWKWKIKMLWRGDWIISQAAMIREYIKFFKTGVLKSFYDQKEDWKIYIILENYFNAVEKVFPTEFWNKDYILSKTTGFSALMNLFSDLYWIAKEEEQKLVITFFESKLEPLKKWLHELTSDFYESWVNWQRKLYNDFKRMIS